MAISVYAFGTGGKRKKIFQDIYFSHQCPDIFSVDLLIVFKAMKMNNNIKATFAGKVKKIDVKEGDNIPNHALMIEME